MKKTILALSILSSTLYAQNIKYSFSQEFESIKKHIDFGFYKFDENKYAEVYYRKGDDMMFQIYDKQFNAIKNEETALLPDDSKHFEHESFRCIKNNFFWFYSTWDRKQQAENLYALPFDKTTFKFSTSPIELIEAPKLANRYNKYTFNTSTDSTKTLITYRVKPREKRDKLNKDIIGFNLFDTKMKKLYSAEIEMPYSEADMDILDHEVDSRNNIYLLAQVKLNNSIDGEDNKENKKAYRYELMRVNQKDNSMQAIKITLDNKFTNSVLLKEDLQHNLIITGYYSNKKNSGSSDGAYIIKLELEDNNSIKKMNTIYSEFSDELLKAYERERVKRKMDKKEKNDNLEASNLIFDRIVFEPDGSMLIMGEEYYMVSYSYRCGNSTCYSYTYYYNDIIVLKADKNGKTLWSTKIPKRQSGSSPYGLSYKFHKYNGEYYFFYLDDIRVTDTEFNINPTGHSGEKGDYLASVILDANGKMSKKCILEMRDDKIKEEHIRLNPSAFESINENLIVDRLREDRKHSKVFRLELK